MRSGLIKEATLVGGGLFVIGATLMQFRVKGITDKKYWPYLGVFVAGFSAHLIFEALGLNKKYCEYAFESEPEEWGDDVEWDENFKRKKKEEEWIVDWDAESLPPLSGQSIESPLELKVYVPSTRKDKSITEVEFEKRVKDTESSLSKMFGGFTSSDVEGGYTSVDGDLISEKVAIVTSWVDENDYRDKLPQLEQFLKMKKDEWQQEVIGFEFENDFFMFPKSNQFHAFGADSKEEARLKKYEKTYGKEGAKVRNRIFKRILAKKQDGTKAGQWSARKAQSLTEDYEKTMKGKNKKPYKSSKKTKSQKDLKDWGDQKWTTKSGKKSSKTGERYLPKKAIKALSDKEYKETSDKKRKDTKKGKQFSKQPKKVAEKVKKYRADGYGRKLKRPSKSSKMYEGWTDLDDIVWRKDRELFETNRYFCKKYEDVPLPQRKSFSGNNLRRGNRCINCRSKECPSKLLRYKEKKRVEELERIAQEQKQKFERNWMENVVKPKREEIKKKRKKSKQNKWEKKGWNEDYLYDGLGSLFGAEGDIPYGVYVQNHKTTSTVFYKRKAFRKFRGNRHREQARAYAQYMENKLKKNPRHFSYWAEEFEAEGRPTEVEVKRSTNDEKKLMAIFTYPDGKTETTHFGQRGASDYTKHGEKERMERYLERHGGGTTTSTKEDWKDPTTAGALSRWILWNKPSLSASFNDFKKRFNLKGDLKVKKSAESFESETITFESFRGRWNVGQTRDIEGVRVKKMRNDFYRLDFQGESTIIRDGVFFEINRNNRGGFSRGEYDRALNSELRRSGYSEKDVPDNMEAIIRWKHKVGGGRLVIRRPFKKARHIFAGGLYHFMLPGQRYDGVFYPTNRGKTYRFVRRNGEPIVGRFPKKNEAWLDIRYDSETFDSDTYITRKNRRTGNKVSLVAPGIEASEDEGWMLICEKHSAVATFETRQQAERHFAYPDQWCEYCMGNVEYYGESFQSPYTPSQELSDYTPEDLIESSAIEGFQPFKYSVMGD